MDDVKEMIAIGVFSFVLIFLAGFISYRSAIAERKIWFRVTVERGYAEWRTNVNGKATWHWKEKK